MMKAEATKWREYCWLLHCSLQLFKVLRRDIRVSSKWRGLVKDSGTLQSHLVFLPVSEWWLSLVRQWLTLKHCPPFKTISPLDNKEPRKSVDLAVWIQNWWASSQMRLSSCPFCFICASYKTTNKICDTFIANLLALPRETCHKHITSSLSRRHSPTHTHVHPARFNFSPSRR